MAKVLLIISGEPKENPQNLNLTEKRFPTGVGYLISTLREHGHQVDFLDRFLLGNVWPESWNYDFVGIYSSTVMFPDTLKIVERVPEGIPIAVGGPHTCHVPHKIPERVKWICQGEGEQFILDLAEGTLGDKVSWLHGDVWRYPRIEDLDELPSPAFDVFDKMPYTSIAPWFPGKVFNFCTSRGCPFDCSFCWVNKIWGHKVTMLSAGRIVEDVLKVRKDFGVWAVYFREDNFAVSEKRLKEFCELLLKKNIKLFWACEMRADVSLDLFPLMRKTRLKMVYVGIESGSQRMLDIYNKKLAVGQIEKFLACCNENSIQVAASVIVNHPKETTEDRGMTRKLLDKYRPAIIWTNPWREGYVIPEE